MGSNIEEEEENMVSEEEGRREKDEEEEEEEEEDDVDFNPFLKGTPSPEASSSLSSEVEGPVEEDVPVGSSSGVPWPGEGNVAENYAVGDSEHGEEVVVCNESEERREGLENGGSDEDDDDAICKRTRAKYSLASFTLDELEMFLQETDDEDDLRNVDDEEEYRKFLAAVLLGGGGGDGDGQAIRDDGNDEEDEDNDADFEIELEELLLESDGDDENANRNGSNGRGGSRPQTRQNKRRMACAQYEKRLLEQTKRPLRPLLPILPNGGYVPFSAPGGGPFLSVGASYFASSLEADSLINGFTPQQIGQLHSLIHEHVQLLVQVFSLSVIDSSRQHVATQLQTLMSELTQKRDEVVGCRSLPFPDVCFHPSHLCASAALPNFASNGQVHRSHSLGSSWVPSISGPIRSILDVVPLNQVGVFVNDVSNAMSEYRKRQLSFGSDSLYEREPLFCYPNMSSIAATHGEVLQGDAPQSTSTGQQQPKKTLAATIVENVKKQSIALVPKDISKLAQRFMPLFNPALFPYKPPPASVANRILFTDAEDELLARGILEFNNDWKAIQQCFLPCKSKHQIFVRQKNRSSSKAPENPIKAVRRMKSSPLTEEEIDRIEEGLKTFKSDWTSVWRFLVPYRDPSLLPRLWRIALGTQKSYRLDAAKKEKRRLYASNKRMKLANGARDELVSGKDNQADGKNANADVANSAFVHQAFLADWRPADSGSCLFEHSRTNHGSKGLHGDARLKVGTQKEQQNHFGAREARPVYWIGNTHEVPNPSALCQYPRATDVTFFRSYSYGTAQPIHQGSGKPLNATKSQSQHALPQSELRVDGAHLVKLAPDLPPVNLPPSVRVIPQSAFRSYTCGQPMKVPAPGVISNDAIKANTVLQPQHGLNSKTDSSSKSETNKGNQVADKSTDEHARSLSDDCMVVHDPCNDEERGSDAVLEMHPLLFQEPEDGEIPYYCSSSTTGASRYFSFFSSNQPQLSLSLLHNPPQIKHVVHPNKSSRTSISNAESCSIDFHPLLQRPDDENHASMASSSYRKHRKQLVCAGNNSRQSQNFVNGVQAKSVINCESSPAGFKHSDQCENANELDLGIYLSSASMNDKLEGNRDGASFDHSISIVGGPTSGNAMVNREADETCEEHRGTFCTALATASASAVPSESASQQNADDMGDHSHPGIVMEQEELSDSDEEIEENVEFECEEMDDSDGEEGSPCEPLHDQRDQTPSAVNVPNGSKRVDQCPLQPEENMSNPTKGSPLLKLSLTSLGKAAATSWLSLESGAPADPHSMTAKQQPGEASYGPESEKTLPSRPNRSRKKTTSSKKGVAAQNNVVDMAQQLSLGPLATANLRKPRKRASRINTSLNLKTAAGTPASEPDKVG